MLPDVQPTEQLHESQQTKTLLPKKDFFDGSDVFLGFRLHAGKRDTPDCSLEVWFAQPHKLVRAVLAVVLQSAGCERGFSWVKHIMGLFAQALDHTAPR